jgi:hypothetical protein
MRRKLRALPLREAHRARAALYDTWRLDQRDAD